MDTLLVFFLNRSFLDIIEKNQNPVLKLEIPFRFRILISNGTQNFKFPEMEFKELEPRFKSAKTRFKFSAGLNLETFNTILSGTNHI